MRLRTRLILSISFASLLPLGLLGWGAVSVAYKHMLDKEVELLEGSSDGMGLYVESWLRSQQEQLAQQRGLFEYERMDTASLEGAMRLIYRQIPTQGIYKAASPLETDRPSHYKVVVLLSQY